MAGSTSRECAARHTQGSRNAAVEATTVCQASFPSTARGVRFAGMPRCGARVLGEGKVADDTAAGKRHVFVLHIRLGHGVRQAYVLLHHVDDSDSTDTRSSTLPLAGELMLTNTHREWGICCQDTWLNKHMSKPIRSGAWEIFVKPALRCTRQLPRDAVEPLG